MDSIIEICKAFEETSLEECQQVLDNPQDTSSTTLSVPHKTIFQEALSKLREATPRDVNVHAISSFKKLCAHSVLGMMTSSDQEGEQSGFYYFNLALIPFLLLTYRPVVLKPFTEKLTAARLIMNLSALPSASAFGVCNSNIIQAVLGTVNKLVGAELKALQSGDKQMNNDETVSVNIQLDEDNDASNARSKRASKSRRAKASAADSSESEEESSCEVDEEDMFGPRVSRSQISASAAARTKLKPQHFHAFMQDALQCAALFSNQSDDFVLSSGADLFVSVLYLCATKPEYSGGLCLIIHKYYSYNSL